ncbi:hypothetical protein EV421DRAFT_1912711 [Armillaria borealis]|uniref:Uncharacterized protein n=1 Tax=Armillaria borealis TaxID=47425 RepID=A0AA39IVF8_9AGAR|nr:hypothetical protein EV421DRAFT_1912711 [Armillaria borealis]
MPPRRAPLPEGIEHDSQTNKVRCLLCHEFDPYGSGKWMILKSLKNHLQSTKHDSNRIRKVHQEQQCAAEAQKIASTYHHGTTSLEAPNSDAQLPSGIGMFTENPDVIMANDESEIPDDLWMQCPLIPISLLDHLAFDEEDERAHLHRQYLLMLEEALSGSNESEAEETDETMAYLADEFRALDLEPLADEEDISNYFNGISQDNNFSPYPNKTTALLDILDNLPHLRLSTSHMQMILWLL